MENNINEYYHLDVDNHMSRIHMPSQLPYENRHFLPLVVGNKSGGRKWALDMNYINVNTNSFQSFSTIIDKKYLVEDGRKWIKNGKNALKMLENSLNMIGNSLKIVGIVWMQ